MVNQIISTVLLMSTMGSIWGPNYVKRYSWEWSIKTIEQELSDISTTIHKAKSDQDYLKIADSLAERLKKLKKEWKNKVRADYWRELQRLIKYHNQRMKKLHIKKGALVI